MPAESGAALGVHLAAGLQRPRHAHGLDRRRQPRRPATGPARRLRHDQRHRAARAHRGLQGAVVHARMALTASGFTSDLVAAIDQAVADGVDVINYSISGTPTNFLDPAEVAFLFAADAGVFVAASAGNSGPTTGTVAHPSPWITTVAAGTHNRDGQRIGDAGQRRHLQRRLAGDAASAPLPDRSTAAGLPGADAAALAFASRPPTTAATPVLDPAKVAGKIVVCDRGVNARVNKSLAVQEAGGVGMILVNTARQLAERRFPFVPTVHLPTPTAPRSRPTPPPRVRPRPINAGHDRLQRPAPFTAAFSSRGPLDAGGGDLLKPDLIAPGQDILAAVAPPGQRRRRLQPVQRHVDVQPARGRPRGAAQGPASRLVADGDQVGADDQRIRRARRARTPIRSSSSGKAPDTCGPRTRPTPASCTTRKSTTGSRSSAGRRRA